MKKTTLYRTHLESLISDILIYIDTLNSASIDVPINSEIELNDVSERISKSCNTSLILALRRIPRGYDPSNVTYRISLYRKNEDLVDSIILKYYPSNVDKTHGENAKHWIRHITKETAST